MMLVIRCYLCVIYIFQNIIKLIIIASLPNPHIRHPVVVRDVRVSKERDLLCIFSSFL